MAPRQRALLFASGGVVVTAAAMAMLFWSGSARWTRGEDPAPSAIELTGIVRDFRASHVDFDIVPPLGPGHDAGTVGHHLADRLPVHTGSGFRVESAWRDAAGRPIAPHLAGAAHVGRPGGAGVHVRDALILKKGRIDSFDSAQGPYGGANRGDDALVTTNATDPGRVVLDGDFVVAGDVLVGPDGDPASVITGPGVVTGVRGVLDAGHAMPPIQVPGDDVVGPNVGDVWYQHVPTTISSNMHVQDLRISTEAVVTIAGHVTIVVEGDFRTETRGVLRVLEGSSLDLYVKGSRFTVETRCLWSSPRDTRVWIVGAPEMKIQTDADFFGSIYAPDAKLLLQTDGELHGSFVGRELEVRTGGAVHVDGAGGCLAVNDTDGTLGATSDGGVHSAASFSEWFRDVLGTNQSMAYTIELAALGGGVYEFATDAFHPIDGRLYGNEGADHNDHFTFTIRAAFAFDACAGQFLEVAGGDGMWAFIDDRLAVDLGGVGSPDPQHLELDRLDLVDGETYVLRLFYADRSAERHRFRLRTNVPLSTASFVPTVSSQYD